MHNKLNQAFGRMQKNYDHLSKGKKFQILAMIIVNGKLNNEIYANKFNKLNYSIVKEHCECQAFENFSKAKDIAIIVTVPPCEQCYKNFIEKSDNIKKIIYLCEDFLENKKHIFEDERFEPASKYINSTKYGKLLKDYLRYKHKKEFEKYNKILLSGVEENVNQPTHS